jgi:NAD(P)-dependent dehydrogenase (short-subunit alcohol dehydrogenase family)
MKWDLEGKSAIVTGAGSGIGRAVALRLGQSGAGVGVVDLEAGRAEAVSGEIQKLGVKALGLPADVSNSSRVAEAVAHAREMLGPIDYLVNIAGFHERVPAQEITDERWQRMINTHLSGTFYFCRAVLPDMIARRFGRIVNMSSLHGFGKVPGAAHYSAAKAGIAGLTKALAVEVAPHGILINAVAPGPVDTALWRDGMTGKDLDERIAKRLQAIPLGRLALPDEVADMIVFFLSAANRHVTGQVVHFNGGELMG